MRRMRRSVASSSVLAGIWEAPGVVRERFVSLISFAPTEYPVLAIQLSLDWDSGGGGILPLESLCTPGRSFSSLFLCFLGGGGLGPLAAGLRAGVGGGRTLGGGGWGGQHPPEP